MELDLGLSEKPQALRAVDANDDGIPDLLVFANEDEAPALWLGEAGGGFKATPKSGAGSFGVVPASATLARSVAASAVTATALTGYVVSDTPADRPQALR